jgi:hypothetical protein
MFNTFIIRDNEKFTPKNYPDVVHELMGIKEGIAHLAIYFKAEIIVSYLRDHSLQTAWIAGNPALAKLVVSGDLQTSNLEGLFESCRNNKPFLKGLEDYLQIQLLKKVEEPSALALRM